MVYSDKLAKFKNLIHGFTTREEGDFRRIRETNSDRQILQIATAVYIYDICDTKDLVFPEQRHGNEVAVVNNKDKGSVIREVDGLITQEKEVILGVTTADCLPILFYEPKKKIAGIVHAGWRGSLKRIVVRMVRKIKRLGGVSSEIIVAIGPHIKSCCYDIDEKRASLFKKEFGSKIIVRRGGRLFLNLTKVNLIQLLGNGIKEKNIEVSPFCTSCNQSLFFSYRRERGGGEVLSFIGLLRKRSEGF